ncbi:MAG: hypothetical protein GC188_08145 [Alphaproteobacteria bacterium]|nr:hypothetical protein [Alphaproteobacteria bacterium]
MWGSDPDILRALNVLGLEPGASLAEAKAAFRQRAKALHPDHTPATPETLSRLADAVKAIRCLEKSCGMEIVLTLSGDEAREGVARTASQNGRSGVFRIEPGTVSGARVSAIGDSAFTAVIRVIAGSTGPEAVDTSGLDRFIDDFVKRPPAARMAGWLRKARSAA